MISFWIPVVRSAICWMAEPAALTIVAEGSGLVCLPVRAGSIGVSASRGVRPLRSGREHPPWDRLAAPQLPGPWCGPDDHTEPAAADIPAVDADVDPCELSAAQQPQVLGMHDAGDGSQVGPCSGEPPRGNQDLRRGQDAHHTSMGTCSAR